MVVRLDLSKLTGILGSMELFQDRVILKDEGQMQFVGIGKENEAMT